MKLTFLHTSKSHIKRFEAIIQKLDGTIQIQHYVNEKLLEHAIKLGQVDKIGFQNEINRIRKDGMESIICTCSTYGELCNPDKNIFRIDQPAGEYLVSNFSKIGIAFTVDSTKNTSKSLLEKLAKEIKKPIQIIEIDCQHAWEWFEKGVMNNYEFEIASQIKNVAKNVEAIFLAQASMEGAKKYLVEETFEVVSSPEFGVSKILEKIKD